MLCPWPARASPSPASRQRPAACSAPGLRFPVKQGAQWPQLGVRLRSWVGTPGDEAEGGQSQRLLSPSKAPGWVIGPAPHAEQHPPAVTQGRRRKPGRHGRPGAWEAHAHASPRQPAHGGGGCEERPWALGGMHTPVGGERDPSPTLQHPRSPQAL